MFKLKNPMCAIYRGAGSAGSTADQALSNEVAQDSAAAEAAATQAATSATAAASSASSASSSASSASTSATNAALSKTSAASSANNASVSSTAASNSASSASSSATAAAASETAAASSETNAASSETAAAASATAAAASETAAAASETAAAASETAAASSETAAAASETAAIAAQAAAEAAQEAIDGLYLGVQTSDPSVDKNGDPITEGDWYYNSTTNVTRIYDGSAWQNGAVDTSSFLLSGNNLSDLGDASTARTNLGVAIGTDVLAYDATVVYDADIGVNVQAYSSVLAATTASYTTAEETKLAGIETGATADQTAQEIATAIDADATAEATLKSALGLGTAAYTASTAYATAAQGTNADTAYGWGNHASAGYLTSYTETDPVYTASSWYTTTNNSTNWDTAYGWGDHSTVGYLTSYTTELSEDTTPQLGGDLDTNGNAIDFGATGWSIALSGTDLVFSYNGTAKIKFASTGEITSVDDVTAFGTV